MGKPRVLFANDHTPVVEAFAKLEADIDVLGNVCEGPALVSTARRSKPDVIVLDLSLASLDAVAVGKEIKRRLPQSKLIVLMDDDHGAGAASLRHWASACVLSQSNGIQLAKAIRSVVRGKPYVSPKLGRRVLELFVADRRRDQARTLTARQREVLQLLAEGRTMKQAAAILNLATRTIAFHKYRIMDEFGLKTNSDLIRFAIRENVLT